MVDKETGRGILGVISYSALPDNPARADLPEKRYSVSQHVSGDGVFGFVALPGPGVISARAVSGRFLRIVRLDPADEKKGIDRLFALGRGLLDDNAYRVICPDRTEKLLKCDLELRPGRTVTVSVVGPDGKPLVGATVLGLDNRPVRPVKLGSATCLVCGLDGQEPRTVTFLHSGLKLAGKAVLSGNEKEGVVVKMEPWGIVTGKVLDRDGSPLVKGLVDVFFSPSSSSPGILRQAHQPPGSDVFTGAVKIYTDHEGKFRVEGLIPGLSYEIIVTKAGLPFLRGAVFNGVSVGAGQTKDLGKQQVKNAQGE